MSQPQILIVEDELIVALELEDRLHRYGYAIAGTARSVEEALAIVDCAPVDLALLDLRLAGAGDGVELAVELRARGIPFVFLTAHGDEDTLARVKAVEPQGYLLKPFEQRLLRLTIETALHRHAAERDRLAAERARRAAESIQATILEHSPDGVLVVTEDDSIVLSNRAAQQMFGLTPEWVPRADELVTGLSFQAGLDQCGTHPVHRVQAWRRDGEPFPAEIACGFALLDDHQRLILIIRDVSAQTRLEEQLARARQLEVAGRVASGVAHDLNNLLSVVWMSSYMLQRAPTSELPGLLEDLDNAVSLGASLTTRLLSMARRSGTEPRVVSVNDALRAIVKLARRAISADVHIALELDPDAGSVRIDPAQLDQLVLNLALNADRAMPEGGRLSIRSRGLAGGEQPFVQIEVQDTGVGIDEAIRARVFEPLFSTRSGAGGTGLGLSIVHDIVAQARGELEFESELGHGTTFRVRLRRHGEVTHRLTAEVTPIHRQLSGDGRVALLVDDDDLHRRSLARLLEAKGFRPLHARGPGEALLMVEREREPIALAIIDMEMPYMDGRELSERLNQLRPDLPTVLISGSATGTGALRKPIEPDTLLAELARVLGDG